jgi:putative transposase
LTVSGNGKQESFWGTLEGRLLKMLDGVTELTLDRLNEVTCAWVEMEYNRASHREISSSPVERFAHAPDVLRDSPSSESLRDAFRLQTNRTQRRSDGTISLEGVRFEIPARFRHFHQLTVRYARWNLGRVDLVDDRNGTILAPIYPLDKTANADGRRALVEPDDVAVPPESSPRTEDELPPLLKKILQEYSATGLPPAYLPKRPPSQTGDA